MEFYHDAALVTVLFIVCIYFCRPVSYDKRRGCPQSSDGFNPIGYAGVVSLLYFSYQLDEHVD